MKIDVRIEEIQNNVLYYTGLKKQGKIIDEENTKHTIVLPILAWLGYNVFSPFDIAAEVTADLKYSRNAKNAEKVDYAILYNQEPKVFIECKKFGEDLTPHVGQLQQYYVTNVNVQRAILTNGLEFWLFSDYENKNLMDSTPYKKINLLNATVNDLEYFNDFKKELIYSL